MSASLSLRSGNFNLINVLDSKFYCVTFPPTLQHTICFETADLSDPWELYSSVEKIDNDGLIRETIWSIFS